jgi:hypothetical protein
MSELIELEKSIESLLAVAPYQAEPGTREEAFVAAVTYVDSISIKEIP